MKRILFIAAFLLAFTFICSEVILAAGQACCDAGTYNPVNGKCNLGRGGQKTPTPCGEGETCIGSDNGGPAAGICSKSATTTECCTTGIYSPTDRLCKRPANLGPSLQSSCGAGQGCVNNYCVTGTLPPDTTLPEFNMCKFAGDQKGDCETCLGKGGVLTALGCIHFEPSGFIKDFMRIALGVAGGIALLLMIYGSFMLSVSTGDPKKAQEGKEIISGTIAGLLFIIFSVFLLKLIGVDILQIPGF